MIETHFSLGKYYKRTIKKKIVFVYNIHVIMELNWKDINRQNKGFVAGFNLLHVSWALKKLNNDER